jgi:hypothetical protein
MPEESFDINEYIYKSVDKSFDAGDHASIEFFNKLEEIQSNAQLPLIGSGALKFLNNIFKVIGNVYGTETQNQFRERFIELIKQYPPDSLDK